MISFFLTFSDSAKYAEAAKNLISGQGLVIHHSFFNSSLLQAYIPGQAWPAGFLPLPSWILAGVFKFFPAIDSTVWGVGMIFWAMLVVLTFVLARKLHSTGAAVIAAAWVGLDGFFLEYGANFSTEILFAVEILLFVYLWSLCKWGRLAALLPLAAMFFTRPQAIVFGLAVLATWVIAKKSVVHLMLAGVLLLGIFWLAKKDVSSLYSPLRSVYSAQMLAGVSPGAYLRGQTNLANSPRQLTAKIFYNFYNFAKAPQRVVHPIILFLFVLALLTKPKENLFALVAAGLFVLAASASLPNARYIHPVVPLIIISASGMMMQLARRARWQLLFTVVVGLIVILPTLGYLTVDRRFRSSQFNIGQPPATYIISQTMARNISPGKLIITNLDAWAAWYSGLTTMWFPLFPDMLSGYEEKIDYIVITNYKENDGDFALGPWQEVVYQPDNIQNEFLKQSYRVLKTFIISKEQVYENQEYRGTILAQLDK